MVTLWLFSKPRRIWPAHDAHTPKQSIDVWNHTHRAMHHIQVTYSPINETRIARCA
jgi:hypothetical protein